MTPQRRGRRWTAKSWTGSRSGLTSRSRRGRTPRHRVATWADPPETLTDSAGAAAEVAVTSAEAGEVTEIPDLATRTEETDTEMSGDMTTTGREIATPPTMTGGDPEERRYPEEDRRRYDSYPPAPSYGKRPRRSPSPYERDSRPRREYRSRSREYERRY